MGKYPYMVVKTHPMAGECSIAGHDMVICESEVYPPFLYGGHIEAKFAAAAWNAFVTAAERLDMDPLELAERLQDGGIAELLKGCHAMFKAHHIEEYPPARDKCIEALEPMNFCTSFWNHMEPKSDALSD